MNRYENVQPPGNLWYHDHAMDITSDNVFHGLSGNYVIYDNQTEESLPDNEYNIIVTAGQFVINDTLYEDPETGKDHGGMRYNPPGATFSSRNLRSNLKRNQTYRVRILNGQYDSIFTNLQFLAECRDVKDGKAVNVSNCRPLTFSVIGSDSAIFNNSVHNVTSIDIASAERLELLIIFDGSDKNGNT